MCVCGKNPWETYQQNTAIRTKEAANPKEGGVLGLCAIYTINPFLLILNVPLILKTGIHLQFPKISVWPIWLLIDPL